MKSTKLKFNCKDTKELTNAITLMYHNVLKM